MTSLKHGRYVVFLGVLIASTSLLCLRLSLVMSFAISFNVAALAFVMSSIPHWFEGAPQTIREQAVRDVGGRFAILLLTLIILGSVFYAVGSLVREQQRPSVYGTLFPIGTICIAWVFANLVMAYHYAHRYYDQETGRRDHGGLLFPGKDSPSFADFVNFAFVLGMTCQTADIAITRSSIRRMTTVHGIVAFFFNLGILALAVNIVAATV